MERLEIEFETRIESDGRNGKNEGFLQMNHLSKMRGMSNMNGKDRTDAPMGAGDKSHMCNRSNAIFVEALMNTARKAMAKRLERA